MTNVTFLHQTSGPPTAEEVEMGVVAEIEWGVDEEIAVIEEIGTIEAVKGHLAEATVAAMRIGRNRDVHPNVMRAEVEVASVAEGAVALEVVEVVVSEEEVVTRQNQNGEGNHQQWVTEVSVAVEAALFPVEGLRLEVMADFLVVLLEGNSQVFLRDRN